MARRKQPAGRVTRARRARGTGPRDTSDGSYSICHVPANRNKPVATRVLSLFMWIWSKEFSLYLAFLYLAHD